MSLRGRTWEIVEIARPGDTVSKLFDLFMLGLIFLNVAAVVIGTVASLQESYGAAFDAFEIFSVLVFTLEYLLRLWSCVSVSDYEVCMYDGYVGIRVCKLRV